MLKTVSSFLYFFVSLALPISAEEVHATKSYCLSEHIELTDSAILIHRDKNTFEVDSLHTDQGGLYFLEDAMRCFYCRKPINPKNTCECLVNQ